MKRDNDFRHGVPEQSYSRELDSRVQSQERPYGYSAGEPAADTGDFNQKAKETTKSSKPKGR